MAKLKICHGVNVVCDGSPSRMRRVLLISLGITIRPRSSTRLTIPVAFIYLSPFSVGEAFRLPRDGKPSPTMILQITLLVSVNEVELYCLILFLMYCKIDRKMPFVLNGLILFAE